MKVLNHFKIPHGHKEEMKQDKKLKELPEEVTVRILSRCTAWEKFLNNSAVIQYPCISQDLYFQEIKKRKPTCLSY